MKQDEDVASIKDALVDEPLPLTESKCITEVEKKQERERETRRRERDASHEKRHHVTSLIVCPLTGDEETKDADEQDEMPATNDGEGEEENEREIETVAAKIKPIPKYASFFIFSHTNG